MCCDTMSILRFAVTALLASSVFSVCFGFYFFCQTVYFLFRFTNNFFLLHVTLIFHTAIFRLQSVHSVSPCHDEISEDLNNSYGSVQNVLTTDLNMRRVSAKFVPRVLTV